MRMLSIKEVAALLREDSVNKGPIGQRAIQAGLITTEQLHALLDAQRELTPSASDLIIEAGWMTRDQMQKMQLAFLREP
ncbi:MAG: hypothetical protein AB8H79_24580 [Myxococcota bacterium]